jgi:tetratricopeptide (TPR) repeat protein
MDLRLPGARYAPTLAYRDGENFPLRRPTPLLEAEVLIAKQLASKPDDSFWLDAQGRADLMNQNYQSAITSLEQARRHASQQSEISIDLAAAYFLRAEVLERSEDYGETVELLGQVLAKDPGNTLALFNRAIASERLFLFEQAVEDWKRYLVLDPHSKWTEEAHRRMSNLQEKIKLHERRSERSLLSPEEFSASSTNNRENSTDEMDQRIERYYDLALVDWVPLAFSHPQVRGTNGETARRAADRVAEILISRHSDYWLADFLEELDHRPLSQNALPFLTEALRASQTENVDHARKAALEASRLFRESGNRAGELMALFLTSYTESTRSPSNELPLRSTLCKRQTFAGPIPMASDAAALRVLRVHEHE